MRPEVVLELPGRAWCSHSALLLADGLRQLHSMTTPAMDLKARAHQAVIEAGFHPDFPAEVRQEVDASLRAPPAGTADVRDLRLLLWSSIDNDQSRDLD